MLWFTLPGVYDILIVITPSVHKGQMPQVCLTERSLGADKAAALPSKSRIIPLYTEGIDSEDENLQKGDIHMAEKQPFFLYKGRPLVRCGNTIYYGSMGEDYVIMMQIHDFKKWKDMDMCGKISVKLIMTDETKNPLERIVKTSEKEGLYPALDIADIWLQDALKAKKS